MKRLPPAPWRVRLYFARRISQIAEFSPEEILANETVWLAIVAGEHIPAQREAVE